MIQEALNMAPCGIISFNKEGSITYVNEPLLTILDYYLEELEGQHIEKIFTISTRIFFQTHLFPLLQLSSKVDEVFITLASKKKAVLPVLINAIQKVEGSQVFNVFACIVVHQRQKFEEEILLAKKLAEDALNKNEELQKARIELEAGKQELDMQLTQLKHTNNELLQLNDLIAHDLQEPVRKIAIYSDLIQKEASNMLDSKLAGYLVAIQRSSRRMQTVLRSLQEYMLVNTNEVEKERLELGPLIHEQLERVAAANSSSQYTVSLEDLPVIFADKKQISILFYHLIKNAFDFKSDNRQLELKISSSLIQQNFYNSIDGKYKYVDALTINMEDNGRGFNPKYKELVFKILRKLDSNTKGLGFGLAMVKRIAQNHRGTVSAEAIEGQGSRFIITLPVHQKLF